MQVETRRGGDSPDQAAEEKEPKGLVRLLQLATAMPFVGTVISVFAMFAPGVLVVIPFQLGVFAASNAVTDGPPARTLAEAFPDYPRAALAAGALSLLLAGFATISWGKLLQRAGARMTLLLIPWSFWGRIMAAIAVVAFVAAMISPGFVMGVLEAAGD